MRALTQDRKRRSDDIVSGLVYFTVDKMHQKPAKIDSDNSSSYHDLKS